MSNVFMARAIENVRLLQGGFGAVVSKTTRSSPRTLIASRQPTILRRMQKSMSFGKRARRLAYSHSTAAKFIHPAGPVQYASASSTGRDLRVCYRSTTADAAKAGFDDSLIYSEIPQPHSERKIPMIQLMPDEAIEAFRAWERQPNKLW